jgi:hypothetical protein
VNGRHAEEMKTGAVRSEEYGKCVLEAATLAFQTISCCDSTNIMSGIAIQPNRNTFKA